MVVCLAVNVSRSLDVRLMLPKCSSSGGVAHRACRHRTFLGISAVLLLVFPQPGGSRLPQVLQVGAWCKCASEQLLWPLSNSRRVLVEKCVCVSVFLKGSCYSWCW